MNSVAWTKKHQEWTLDQWKSKFKGGWMLSAYVPPVRDADKGVMG